MGNAPMAKQGGRRLSNAFPFSKKPKPVSEVEKKPDYFGEDNSEVHSEDEHDEVADLPEPSEVTGAAKQRMSVSAEAYGAYNKQEDFVPPVVPKSDDQKEKLSKTLENSFLFNSLEGDHLKQLIDAFTEKGFEQGETMIKQGDEGNELYVLESGTAEVFKTQEGEEKLVNTMIAGDVVGELALMYNSPRAATVRVKESCVVWVLDRGSFSHIVKFGAAQKRTKFVDLIKKVSVLQDMDEYERVKLADALKTKQYAAGDDIIVENEPGDTFYILTKGKAEALKENQVVKSYVVGDYFGELALLKNQPRVASVKATTDGVEVIYLNRKAFQRLLGPVHEILERNSENYKLVCAQLGIDTGYLDQPPAAPE